LNPGIPAAAISSADIRVRELITPEGVDLRLNLAEAGIRAAAFFLDVAIIVGTLVTVSIGLILVSLTSKYSPRELMLAVWLLVFFFSRNLYFMAFELTPRAATPGKRILGLRVAMRDGGPLTAEAIFARNAMRELELFLPLSLLVSEGAAVDFAIQILGIIWCAVFVLFPLFNRDRLRVGDLVAGTWVVCAPKRVLDVDLSGGDAKAATFSTEAR
jgi:uncharacterized RDD family membrane protein YckC